MIASGLGTSESAVPYTDVTDNIGYIARAYEIGCITGDRYFVPDDEISRGEMFELSDCIHTAIQSSISDPIDIIVETPTEIIATNPTQDPPKNTNPETNTPPNNVTLVSSEAILPPRVIENKTTIIERTIETRVESPVQNLPNEPGTLLGYGIDGNLITISLGEGVFLDGNNLRVIQNPILSVSEGVFGSAPSNPPTQNPPTNSLYPTTPMTQFQVITG
jgi:hypothetical protein